MDKDQLDPVAGHLISAFTETLAYSRHFTDEHSSPPSMMAKVHHMLSVVQAAFADDDRFELLPEYAEYGRVQFIDRSSNCELLLRSAATLTIEKATEWQQGELFALPQVGKPSGVQLVVHRFTPDGLTLSVAGTVQRDRRKRLLADGAPIFVGIWPYASGDEPSPFDQAEADPFTEVGDFGYDDDAAGDL